MGHIILSLFCSYINILILNNTEQKYEQKNVMTEVV